MQLRVLGPLDLVDDDGRALPIGGPKERRLLAALAVHLDAPVSEARLSDALWGDEPPASATKTLQSYVSRLRRALGTAAGLRIESVESGYALRCQNGAIDTHQVDGLVATARDALGAGDLARAAELLAAAERLWRGPVLGDLAAEPFALAEVARLEEQRLTLIEQRVDIDLERGRHRDLVSELDALTSRHPLRERLWAARILALYRTGRQADALRAYQQLRQLLADELGIDPSAELRDLERAVLRQAPELAWRPPPGEAGEPAAPPVADRPVADLPAPPLPSGTVTFLLTDVEGSTPLWDAAPEAMDAALRRHDEILAAAVTAHDGTLLKARGEGDSSFSVFRRASQAAAAALAAQSALQAEPWPPGAPLRVRMALHMGESVERDGDYYGPAVNRVARLRGLAAGGEVLVSRSTAEVLADQVGERWYLEELGMQSLKGLSRPEHVFRLLAEPPAPTGQAAHRPAPHLGPTEPPRRAEAPLPPGLLGDGSPFVGRVEELEQLRSALEAVTAGGFRALLLGGEPGIGKTTLAAELARRAHDGGAQVHYGRCDEFVTVAYQPFLAPLRALVAACSDEELAADLRGAAELTRLVPELADRLADLPVPVTGEPEAERHALFGAVGDLVARRASGPPQVLVLDDLHWATTPTVLLLGDLLRRAAPGIMVVATYRDTEVGDGHPLAPLLADAWRLPGVERVDVGGLGTAAVAQLCEIASGATLDAHGEELAQRIGEGAGGNPFFVLELLRHLAETGVLHDEGSGWNEAVDLTSVSLPASVVEVLDRRLGRLPEAARRMLNAASVAGPEIDVPLLATTLEMSQDAVVDLLDAAADAGLLVEGETGFAFAHALVRQALLARLSASRRRQWHRALAETLAQRPEPQRPVEALAHHLSEAAVADPALCVPAAEQGLAAARRAARSLAHEVALSHVDRALAVLRSAPQPAPSVRCDLLLVAAAANFALVGRTDSCRRPALAAAVAALDERDPTRVAAAAELAMGGLVMTYDTSHELAIIDAALRLPAPAEVTARLTAARSLALLGAGHAGDQEEAARAVDLARAAGDDGALVAALHAQSASLLRSPDLGERLRIASELAELGERDGPGAASRVALSHTDVELYRSAALLAAGDLAAFEAQIALLDELYARTGDWELKYFSIAHHATTAAIRGDLAALERHADEMIAHDAARPPDPELPAFDPVSDGSSIGNNSIRLYAAYQFILHRERGLLEGLLPLFRQAVEDDPTIAAFGAALAVAEADLGLASEARASFDRALSGGLDAIPRDQLFPLTIGVLCEGCALVAAPEWAPVLRAEAAPYAGQLSAGAIATIVFDLFDRCLGMLDLAEERWSDAVERLGAAADQARRLGAPVFEARALSWSAVAHERRNGPGDASRAAGLTSEAVGIARRLGYAGLEAAVTRRRPGG